MSTFEAAVAHVKALPAGEGPSNDIKLQLYALYKQATEGDCNTAAPSFYQLEAKAKWNAWNGVKGKSQDDAKAEYVALLKEVTKGTANVFE